MFSIITIAASIIAPIAIAMPPSDMMSAPTPTPPHGDERHQDADRQREDRHQRRARVQQEHDAHERDDDALLEQLARSVSIARSIRSLRSYTGRSTTPGGKTRLYLREARLHVLDGRERVLAEPHHHDAAHGVAPPVELGDAAPHRRAPRTRAPARPRESACPDDVAPTTTFSMSASDLR